MKCAVTGAGGFIGGHLVQQLLAGGHEVRASDIKLQRDWFQKFDDAENLKLDLRDPIACRVAISKCDQVYNLAASMGGMGYIETHKSECMLNVLINTNLLIASRDLGIQKYFFSSSACVYPQNYQQSTNAIPLSEDDAYPADAEDGYGWEKLFSERMCSHFSEEFEMQAVVARYHNVYGTHGTYKGGREKAPAAICRKVIEAKLNETYSIEIWGTGHQTRSFMWIDDCIHGTMDLMELGVAGPVNLGSSELVSINQLVDLVEQIAGLTPKTLKRVYNLSAPRGVNGRNSDNSMIRSILGWEPQTPLWQGMEKLYHWTYAQMTK